MYKFQNGVKTGAVSIFAAAIVLLLGMPRAYAVMYTYTLASASGLSGSITTTCDTCVLDSSNITAWTMTAPGLSIASTASGAQVSAQREPIRNTDMMATPEGIIFSFGGNAGGEPGPFVFSTPSGSISFADKGSGSGTGAVTACTTSSSCTVLASLNSSATIASVPVPFMGAVSYTFTGKVTSATGIYAAAGATVSGTFTFDLDDGFGGVPVSFTTPWSTTTPYTSKLVLSTLNSGSVSFSDTGNNITNSGINTNTTRIAGLASTGSGAPNEYYASDAEYLSLTNTVQHSLQIVGGTGANAPFNSNGLPVFQNATGTGTLLSTTSNATDGQLTYTLTSLTAVPATLSVAPATLSFPDTLVNTQSAPLTVTITNTSPNDVLIEGLNFDNTNYLVTNNCPLVLHTTAKCTLSIVFAPTGAEGLHQSPLSIADDAQGSPQQITLSGTATLVPVPTATLTTQAVAFTDQPIGISSAEQPVTIKNTGSAPLTFSSITVTTDSNSDAKNVFTLRSACVPALQPGKACTVFVSFKPVAVGPVSARLVFADNASSGAAGGTTGQTIGLSGNGTSVRVPTLALNVTSLHFSDQVAGTASAKQAFDLTNMGTAPLNIASIALSGSQASDFILQNACVPSLPVGQHCAVFVTFKPSFAGNASAAVVITSNAGSAVSVPLSGTATPAPVVPVLTLNTAALDFGSQKDGTASTAKPVVLTNNSGAPVSLSSIAIVGVGGSQADFTLNNNCVAVLQPGRNCALFVTFNPIALTSAVVANLVINSNAQGSPQTVSLTGTGL